MRKFLILRIFVFFGIVFLGSQALLARELTDKEKRVISDTVRKSLLDPDSARFKWIELIGEQPKEYCGVVNSKNTFGGYAGDAPYIVMLDWMNNVLDDVTPLSIGNADWNSVESQAILMMCASKGYRNLYLAK